MFIVTLVVVTFFLTYLLVSDSSFSPKNYRWYVKQSMHNIYNQYNFCKPTNWWGSTLPTIYRFWRHLHMEMVIYWTIIPTYKKLWFGYFFTPTFQSITGWNVGARLVRLMGHRLDEDPPHHSVRFLAHVKRTAHAVSQQLPRFLGQRIRPMVKWTMMRPTKA